MDRGARGRLSSRSAVTFGLLGAACLAGLVGAGEAWAGVEGLQLQAKDVQGRVTRQERPFGFLSDGSTPSAGVVSLGYAFGLGSGIAAERPLPVNLAAGGGGSHSVSLGYGATGRLSPFVSASFAQSATAPGSQLTSSIAGATWQLTNANAPLHVSLSGGVALEAATGAFGLSTLAAASLDRGPLRVAANLRADKLFAPGRDSVDLFTLLGVSWRVAAALRLGAEYVGQDLEDAFEVDLEGGARHAVGPSMAVDLDGGRYQVTVASGFGVTPSSPRAVVRAGVALNF